MKYLSKFENFDTDETRYIDGNVPKINPVISLKAKNFVDKIFDKGSGSDVNELCKEIGADVPKTDEDLDSIKELAIKYYTENPERIKDTDGATLKRFDVGGGDRVARTNNVGGALRESTNFESGDQVTFQFKGQTVDGKIKKIVDEKSAIVESKFLKQGTSLPLNMLRKVSSVKESNKPSPNDEDSSKIDLTKDEMKLFNTEAMLMKLIRSNKISLYKNVVWYKTDDEKTKKVLDIFFDVEGDEPTNIEEVE